MKIKKLNSYYEQCLAISKLSPDEQTKVGSLLINKDTGAVMGSAYNGFCRDVNDDILPKVRPGKYEYMIHSEMNLILNSARHGINMSNCFVFCTMSPCVNCTRALYQSGINVVYFKNRYRDFEKNLKMLDLSIIIEKVGDYEKMIIDPRRGYE